MDKTQKMLVSIILISLIATASSSIFSSNPFTYINFWMDTYYCYEKVNGHWVTFDSTINRTSSGTFIPINCKNNGATALTFNITVSFTNALFSAKTPSPHHQINHTAACFTFTLQIGEKQSAPVYFLIDETFAHFTISLNLQSNLYVESANDHDFSGYRQLYYIWVPERHTYSPILA